MLCLYKNNIASEVSNALSSAFDHQSRPPNELIVVFDGPVCQEVIKVVNYFESQYKVTRIYFPVCRGHGIARAAAINACNYEWVAIIDADDVSMPERFKALFKVAALYPDSAVVGGSLIEFTSSNGITKFYDLVSYPESPQAVVHRLALRCPIAQPTSILRVAAIKSVGNYQDWHGNEDYFLWIRLIASGYSLRNIPEPVLWFRISPQLFSRRGGLRYWLSESRLQYYSYKVGTSSIHYLIFGILFRLFFKVLISSNLRKFFYSKIIRKI